MRRIVMTCAAAAIAAAAWAGVGSATALAPRGAVQAPDGKMVYVEHCKVCHGAIGVPTKSAVQKYEKIPNFKEPGFFATRSQDSIVTVLKHGKGKDMKSWAEKLSDAEMTAVAQYVLTLGVAK
jgi:mono/diheme cytochrome c family protein